MVNLIQYVPRDKRHMIKEIFRDEDGYWCFIKPEYRVAGYFAENVIHEDNFEYFMSVVRSIVERSKE